MHFFSIVFIRFRYVSEMFSFRPDMPHNHDEDVQRNYVNRNGESEVKEEDAISPSTQVICLRFFSTCFHFFFISYLFLLLTKIDSPHTTPNSFGLCLS